MPQTITYLATCVFLVAPTFALANDLTLIHTQGVGGIYTQDWHAQRVGHRNSDAIAIYVVGDGKLGDFFGVLAVDCETPRFSKWISQGGYLSTDDLPIEAISGIRRFACN